MFDSDSRSSEMTEERYELEDVLDDLGPDETRVLTSIAHRARGAGGRARVPRVRVAQGAGG
jgi:hypothetical protein